MKKIIILILLVSCSSARVVSTNEYYADGLIKDCQKLNSWRPCYQNLKESLKIYRELKLKKKETLTVVRLINLYRNNKKNKHLESLAKEIKVLSVGELKKDASLLYDLSILFLRNKKDEIEKVVAQVLNSSEVSPRRLYILNKFYNNFNDSLKLDFQIVLKKVRKYSSEEKENYYLDKIKTD